MILHESRHGVALGQLLLRVATEDAAPGELVETLETLRKFRVLYGVRCADGGRAA